MEKMISQQQANGHVGHPQQKQRPNGATTGSGRTPGAKSKLERIAELEATLKLSKEENRRLKKEAQRRAASGASSSVSVGGESSEFFPHPSAAGRRSSASSQLTLGTTGSNDSNSQSTAANVEKMRDALKALKRVTINQELSLQSLRAKASQRRSELEARDVTIAKLQKQVAALRKANGGGNVSSNASTASSNTADVVRRLQDGLMDEESKNVELTEMLQAAEAKNKSLERQLEQLSMGGNSSSSLQNPPPSPLRMTPVFARQNSLASLKSAPAMTGSSTSGDNHSVASGSTTDFDVSKLKKELAKKSNRIVQLEYELEETKDELHQVKQQLLRQRHKQHQQQTDVPSRNKLHQQQQQQQRFLSSAEGSNNNNQNGNSFFDADFSGLGSNNNGDASSNNSNNLFGSADPFAAVNHQSFSTSASASASFEHSVCYAESVLLDHDDDDDDIDDSDYHPDDGGTSNDLDEWF
ncbi:hypothetical protein ACA910_020305 [Epithemia clementina (nom. ined.)]